MDPGWWREEVTTPPIWTQVATTIINSTTVNVTSFSYPPIVGQQVSGTGIAALTTVAAVGGSSFTLSQNATASGTTALTMGCEPITSAQCQAWGVVQWADPIIPEMIQGAREEFEGPRLKRAIMLQARTLYLFGFPWGGGFYNRFIRSQGPSPWWLPSSQGIIRMAYPPFQGLISIQYIDQNSGNIDSINLSTMVTQSVTPATPGCIMPTYGQVWPIPRPQVDAVRINFMCGYGAFPSQVPQSLQNGMMGMVAATYLYRQEWMTTREMVINPAIERAANVEQWGSYN
jgi:hypothetical protein